MLRLLSLGRGEELGLAEVGDVAEPKGQWIPDRAMARAGMSMAR